MSHQRTMLRLCLLALTGLSCGLFSRIASSPTPTERESTQAPLYRIEDALTLAMQTILAKTEDIAIPVPATDTRVVETQTAVPSSTDANSQFTILGEHKVVAGETISCIGRGYRVLPKAIADANGIDLLSELTAGQVLKIPAVQWTAISAGPVCPTQFALLNWEAGATQQPQFTKTRRESDTKEPPVSDATQPPPPGATEPPPSDATEPPPSNVTEPPARTQPPIVIPRCPPFCLTRPPVFEITPPTEPEIPPTNVPVPTEATAAP